MSSSIFAGRDSGDQTVSKTGNAPHGTIVSWSLADTSLMEKLELIQSFASGLIKESKDLKPEIVQMVNDNFWDLLA